MDFHWFPWVSIDFSWIFLDFSWISMGFHGFPWITPPIFPGISRLCSAPPRSLETNPRNSPVLFLELRVVDPKSQTPNPSPQIPTPKSRDNGFSRQFTAPSPAEAQDWVEQIQFLLKGECLEPLPLFWESLGRVFPPGSGLSIHPHLGLLLQLEAQKIPEILWNLQAAPSP